MLLDVLKFFMTISKLSSVPNIQSLLHILDFGVKFERWGAKNRFVPGCMHSVVASFVIKPHKFKSERLGVVIISGSV